MDAVFFFKRRKICKDVQKKQKSNYCIYNIICPDTKKIIYIGMTKNVRNRYFNHLTPQIYSTNKKDIVFNKYIEEGKIVLIKITHHLTTQEEAIRVEKEQILKTPGLLNDYNHIQKPHPYKPKHTIIN
jgi:predicted GIY-YIG superfamily endonuclease